MTVIYFLYLFAFIEMLPPRDLGSVMLRLQETEPAGPLPRHPPPTASLLHSHHVPLRWGSVYAAMETAFLHFPPLDREISFSFPGTPTPGKDFLGWWWGSPTAPSSGRLQGESGTKSCGGEATGTLLGQR